MARRYRGDLRCVFHNTFRPAAAGALANCAGLLVSSNSYPAQFGEGAREGVAEDAQRVPKRLGLTPSVP
jgi:hypothetical protein